MPHPLYGPPSVSLEAITVQIHLDPTGPGGHCEIHGRSSQKRTALWLYSLDFTEMDGLALSDHIAHVVQVGLQDRPNTQDRFDFSVTGGLQGEPLPFPD